MVWIIAIAIAAFFMNFSGPEVGTPNLYFFWTGFSILCAVGDVRNLYLVGLSGLQRLIRHVWRIGFSLIWAALALTDKIVKMGGSNVKEMPEEQVLYIVAAPTIFILTVFLYWIINILFFSRNKFTDDGAK